MSIYDDLDDFRIIWRDYNYELRLTPVVFNKYVTIIIMIRKIFKNFFIIKYVFF